LNRVATINQVTTTQGATTAAALQHQLASHGLLDAHVTCAKTMIVNGGTTTSCELTGRKEQHDPVHFQQLPRRDRHRFGEADVME
jgi:hypothetical protein